jgi:hypothetical protein
MKMRGIGTRKNCPACNRLTYIFNVKPLRGFIYVTVLTIGPNNSPTEYELKPEDVEILQDENDSGTLEDPGTDFMDMEE